MKIGTYETVKIEKNDKLEEQFWEVNGQLKEEGCELYLETELSYSYNGEEIWLSEDAEDNNNENVTMVSNLKVDGVLEILCVGLGR